MGGGMKMPMGGAGGGDKLKETKRNCMVWCCLCTMPLLILLIVLSSYLAWMDANMRGYMMAFNMPQYPGTTVESYTYMCGADYDDIVEDLFDMYYKQPMSMGRNWHTDFYLEVEFDVNGAETYRDRFMALQDKATNYMWHPYNVSFDITGDTLTAGANFMGVFPEIDVTDEVTRQWYTAFDRAEAWCNDDITATAEVAMGFHLGATAEDILMGTEPILETYGEGWGAGVGFFVPGQML